MPSSADHTGRRAPVATYRVQLHAGFDFDAAAGIAGYLGRLGVSHLYLSPILQAAAGSTHGYDVVDPTRVNRELGGEEGYARLCEALGDAGLGQLLDVVPNHMAITGPDNRWWWDVLRLGRSSRYAGYFDVDWDSPEVHLRDTVLLPVLGDHYGRELEAGHLLVAREGEDFSVRYFDHSYPLDPATLGPVLAGAAARVDDEEGRVELERLAGTASRVPPVGPDPDGQVERRGQVQELTGRLRELLAGREDAGAALDGELACWNADPDRLDGLLDAQHYRLAWWRSGGENLDYRRFFDINDLAALRVEQPAVFADSHRLVLDWLGSGVLDGLRIDHVDGLLEPRRYLQRLAEAAPEAWVVVEKILEGDERLPEDWSVAGTTGYDWLNRVGDVLTFRAGWERLVGAYGAWTGVSDRLEAVVHTAKWEVLDGPLASDLSRLVARLAEVCERHRRHRDHTRRDLREALGEVAACFPVYRTYVAPAAGDPDVDPAGDPDVDPAGGRPVPCLEATAGDVAVVEGAVLEAGMRRAELDPDLLGLVRDVLLGRVAGQTETEVALRFQQLTGPVMAKAVEDTAFYRWMPLLARNEVGGDPGRLDDSRERFHAACAAAAVRCPRGLLGLSTHDTKRSEDVRARLSVLAEMPEEWAAAVEEWWSACAGASAPLMPDRNTAWLIAQTLVGAWPLDGDRMAAYVEKATREAKQHTSWTDPDPVYDEAVAAFSRAAVEDSPARRVLLGVVGAVTAPGRAVSLAQKLLTLFAPGVPDLYQGSELWDLSLVDPDNRRPVDYERRRDLLESLEGDEQAARVSVLAAWASGDEEGLAKLWVVRQALVLRAAHPGWFSPDAAGDWEPLASRGVAADHLVAARRGGALAITTRWPLRLERAGGWRDTVLDLPVGVFADRLAGGSWEGEVPVGDLLSALPVALLVDEAGVWA